MIRNVFDYLENQAQVNSEKIAVIEESRVMTFEELLTKAEIIGTKLLKYDVFRKPVCVFMEKGIDAVSVFMGIVASGGFYSVLNPELPEQRLKQIFSVLQPGVVITSKDLFSKAGQMFPSCTILSADRIKEGRADADGLKQVRDRLIDTDPLYVNFTSGSTGIPKGIVVAHRSVIDFVDNFTEIFNISRVDILANQAPFDFDVSVKDIYSMLKTGASLVIVPRYLFSNPTALLDYLCENKVTTMVWAVSALCLITTFHGLEYRTPKTVNKILFSGEVMPCRHLRQWLNYLPDCTYVNLYGPTEITCNCTYHILEKNRDYIDGIPIGKSFPNEDVFLLDEENHKITKPDSVGSIMVRGTALALGYYALPEYNAGSFIQNPLNPAYPEPVYRTGDLGRYDESGELYFCGRLDNQVKYMGHRIELEEVERAMAGIEGVERCFCVFEKEKLKGFYVGNIDKKDLFNTMKDNLPIFMIPAYLRKLDSMPMTKNGKIDRKEAVRIAEGRHT